MANLGQFFDEKGGVPQCLKHLAYFSKCIASWTVLVGFESPRVIFLLFGGKSKYKLKYVFSQSKPPFTVP